MVKSPRRTTRANAPLKPWPNVSAPNWRSGWRKRARARRTGANSVKISGAQVRRFLDAPDKSMRAVLLYGPNESFVHDAAQKLVRWALGKSDDPYAVSKLGEDD